MKYFNRGAVTLWYLREIMYVTEQAVGGGGDKLSSLMVCTGFHDDNGKKNLML